MPRKVLPLSDSEIKAAKPKEKLYQLFDGQGLYLDIKPNGSKLWRFKYRFAGQDKPPLSLGAYPDLPLVKARQKRTEARQLLAEGIDPGAVKKAAKQAQMADKLTFEVIALEWFAYNAPRWAESTSRKAKLYLDNDIIPSIGSRPMKEITRSELVELVRKVEARGTLNAAGKIRQWLHHIFRYALAKGVVSINPATELNVVAQQANAVRHHPHIAFTDLPELLSKLETTKMHLFSRCAIQLLILTAVRPGELRNALWVEFDLEAATWTIPKGRMKARRTHVVPLPQQAVGVLRQLHEKSGSYALLFPGQQDPDRPMSDNTVNKTLRAMGYEGRQTGHGFRHLLSTELNGRNYNRDWIERQLAHGDIDEIRATYNHAIYLDQRREMMQSWADSIDTICATTTMANNKREE